MKLKFLLICAGIWALGGFTLYEMMGPTKTPPARSQKSDKVQPVDNFKDRFVRVIPLDKPAAEPPAVPLEKSVKTFTIKVPKEEPSIPPQEVVKSEPEPIQEVEYHRTRPRRQGANICDRTGGWKVVTRGGKSWRCAYARGRRR